MSPTWTNLVAETAKRAFVSKRATEHVLRRFFEQLAAATWSSGRVVVPGLGAFRVRARKPRLVADSTLTPDYLVPEHRVVVCRIAKSWRRRG